MAFGLGFNKGKTLAAAEKYVAQGKIPSAIEEYKKILDHDSKDLTILNIVGDLYLRINKNEEALKCFYRLGETYIESGFVRNAIAVYRRISRVDTEQIEAVLKLADLYTMQGQLNEARTLFQQAADYYSKRGQADKCVESMEKILLLDPENVSIKQRLAQLYEQAGRKGEAASMFFSVAESFADRANPGDADKALKRARELGMFSPEMLVLQARIQLDDGRAKDAIATLGQIPPANVDKGALNAMFHAYTAAGDADHAAKVARKLFDDHDDAAGLATVADNLVAAEQYQPALDIYQHMSERLIAQHNTAPLVDGLKKITQAMPNSVAALKLLRQVYQQGGQATEAAELAEQLARAEGKAGATRPAAPKPSPEARDMGLGEALVSPAPAPPEPELSPEEKELLNNAITESDLYVTYRQYDKALAPLEKVLDRLPRSVALNERLMDLYERATDFDKALKRAEVLAEIYVVAGDAEKAASYSDRIVRYTEKLGGAAGPVIPDVQVSTPVVDPGVASAAPPPPAAVVAPEVREVDLSDWESMVGPSATAVEAPPAAGGLPPEVTSGREEIEFYLAAGLLADANKSLAALQAKYAALPEVKALATKVGAAAAAAAAPEGAVQEIQFGDAEPVKAAPPPPPPPPPPAAKKAPPAKAAAPEPEFELAIEDHGGAGDDFELALEEEPAAAARPTPPPSPPVAASAAAAKATPPPPATAGFDSLVGALDNELADVAPAAPSTPPSRAAKSAPPPAAAAGRAASPAARAPQGAPAGSTDSLSDVFDEFKAGMEDTAAAEADIETHFNMGVAFKEMQLWDEAIGEFQKAFQAAGLAKSYQNYVRCCTLLAHCFMEKKLASLAVRWLETALKAPGLEPEDILALRYEMGQAYESAGNKKAALESFMEVYALNIDYRDVAERIRELQVK